MHLARFGTIAALALALAGCGGGKSAAPAPATATETASSGGCATVEQPAARPEGELKASTAELDRSKTYTLTLATSCGSFTVTLDPKLAPKTTASLVALARAGFFDGTIFHRVVPGFVIQGGDPTQTGSGGPGYQTVDPPPSDSKYLKGVVAMAKTSAEPPGTSGSQFFVVTAGDAQLPPDYAIVGKVTAGLDVVERIGELGDPATQRPLQPFVIDKVTVGES